MESNWQDVSRCYIDGFTSAAQPLDRAVVKPFKEALRNAAAADLAEMVASDLDDLSTVMNRPGLKNKIVQWVHTALDDIKSKERLFQHAWSRLFVEDGGRLFKRQQQGIVPEVLPDAAEPDQQDAKDEPESDWEMHNADAPDDEDAGQETPALAPAAQVEIQAQAAAASEDAPGQAAAAKEETRTQKKAPEAPVLAYCIWPMPTMSETLDSVGIVLSSHPPDLSANLFFEPVRLFDGWQSSVFREHPVVHVQRVGDALLSSVDDLLCSLCVGCCFLFFFFANPPSCSWCVPWTQQQKERQISRSNEGRLPYHPIAKDIFIDQERRRPILIRYRRGLNHGPCRLEIGHRKLCVSLSVF